MNKEEIYRINTAAYEAWAVNVANGWWDERKAIAESGLPGARANVVIACLGLVTSEVAEAMEAVRKHDPKTWADTKTKDTLARELAGATVRIMDLATALDIDLGQAIHEEVEANKARGHKHGGKAA